MKLPRTIILKYKNIKIAWIFGYDHDFELQTRYILPAALPEAEFISYDNVDAVIGVYLNNLDLFSSFPAKMKFLIGGECETRYDIDCIQIVQDPKPWDNPKRIRYGPSMSYWCHPTNIEKKKICSVIDGGKYKNRLELINKINIPQLEKFGKAFGKELPGYHSISKNGYPNHKFLALGDFAFHIAIERMEAYDYFTEKIGDSILSNCVPIYNGCRNISDYFLKDSYILISDIDKIDWFNWKNEYNKRKLIIEKQKEILLKKFNIFSYFINIMQNINLLDKPRPLILEAQ